jgi:tRNA(fMet)-specific endonuclease VapC
MMLSYLPDTNIINYTIKNRPPRVRERFNDLADHLAISTVTLGELIYGVEKSQHAERNQAVIDGLAARLKVLPFDAQAAAHFGQIRADLTRRGRPIGPYDMMIAGQARSRGLILVTNNTDEFERVPGLRLENWVADPA